jgi:hypothetical protein
MAKSDLNSGNDSIENPDFLKYISSWESGDPTISNEERRIIEIGIQQAEEQQLKDHSSVMKEVRAKIGK